MIQRHIRKMLAYHLLVELLVMAVLYALIYIIPFQKVFSPVTAAKLSELETLYEKDEEYVSFEAGELHYTGYNQMKNGEKEGSYYYVMENGVCYFLLLEAGYGKEPTESAEESVIASRMVTGRILKTDDTLKKMAEKFASDLTWSEEGLLEVSSSVYLSEPAYHLTGYQWAYRILWVLFYVAGAAGIGILIVIAEPRLHPSMLKILPYGSVKKHLKQANQELQEPVLADYGRLKITTHYIVNLGRRHSFILPLKHIVWVFRIGDVQRKSIRFISIRYNLYIYARYGVRMISSSMTGENAAEVVRYLKMYSEDILTGYSEENHKLAKQYQKNVRKNKKIV